MLLVTKLEIRVNWKRSTAKSNAGVAFLGEWLPALGEERSEIGAIVVPPVGIIYKREIIIR